MRIAAPALLLLTIATLAAAHAADPGFVDLFDGKNLQDEGQPNNIKFRDIRIREFK